MSLIRLHRNPKGKAFKKLFEYIKKKFPDKEFQRKDMPEVPKDYLNEVKMQTAGTYWIDSSPSICAIETLLIDMCNNELLQKREVQRMPEAEGSALIRVIGVGGAVALAKFSQFPVSITPWSIVVAFLFAALVGIFFGLHPARKASNLQPIEALRYE